jgi:SAM-dependent methyltransferase
VSIAQRISRFNRRRKWKLFLEAIKPAPHLRVLDVGYSDHESSETDNFIEKHYPYPGMLTALTIEHPINFKSRYPQADCVQYDGRVFPFGNASFDVCWSNAVIEHVGDRNNQLMFLKEIKRVSRRAMITTPNKYFPIEVHTRTPFLHFLPRRAFDFYLKLLGKQWATGSYMNLLSLSQIKSLLQEAGVAESEIVKNRLLGFSLDFVIIMNSGAEEARSDHNHNQDPIASDPAPLSNDAA